LFKLTANKDGVIMENLTAAEPDVELAEQLRSHAERLRTELHKVVIGQDEIIEHLLIALFSRGHALLIGVPGLAKTLLVKALASALGWEFKRIQFTPDLMPSDITGTEILQTDPATGERAIRFIRGPLFANLILADEINRTPPKTQAALLEAMQEYAVTVSGQTMKLDPPFFVVATQNPIEHEGTYPLPEAQLDRFMFSLQVDYPNRDEEIRVVDETTTREPSVPDIVFSRDQILAFQSLVRRVPVSRHVTEYAVTLARSSRPKEPGAPQIVRDYVEWGAGPRASQYLILAAKTRALLRGSGAPHSSDVRAVAPSVLRHRIIPNYQAAGENLNSSEIVAHLLKKIPEPDYKA
jgi:MoxR-like ATPase